MMRRTLPVLFFAACLSASASAQNVAQLSSPASASAARSSYGKLPLSFEANTGQTDARVKFLSRGNGYTLFLTKDEATVALRKSPPKLSPSNITRQLSNANESAVGETVRMRLLGANSPPRIVGADELPGKANYFIGNDPSKWRTNVPTYAKVRYKDVYPGIDLVYYGNQGQLEYDFVVAPGTDPRSIHLAFQGGGKPSINPNGDLVFGGTGEAVRFQKPVIYQVVGEVKKPVEGSYVMASASSIAFRLGKYDHSQPLVIDPALVYSTYLGEGGVDGNLGAIAVDPAGNMYVTGSTLSPFPITSGVFQPSSGGNLDVFISKLNADGSALVYSTYLGGIGNDYNGEIAVDGAGDAYITGGTNSANFPGTGTCVLSSSLGQVFVSKLNPTGSQLLYSTCLGAGAGGPIKVDDVGDAYVAGAAVTLFPTTPGAVKKSYSAVSGLTNGFVCKLNADGSTLLYSTYLGGTVNDFVSALEIDPLGNAYVTGYTQSSDFPTTVGAFQTTLVGGANVFVTKLNASGTALIYSTFLGGTQSGGTGIAIDSSGNAYVSGDTHSPDFPTTPGAFQTTLAASINAFISKLNASGSALIYSTFLGGSGQSQSGASGIAIDRFGHAYVTGFTSSSFFPTTPGAFQTTIGGNVDAFISELNGTGSALLYSTFLGGNAFDVAHGIAVDALWNVYVVGGTGSTNFPTTANALQPSFDDDSVYGDAFVFKMGPGTAQSIKQGVMFEAENLLHDSPPEPGSVTVQDAIRELQLSLFYKLWAADGDHINSSTVFEDEEQAVTYLNTLIGDDGGGYSVSALEGCVNNLVEADAILASIAITDATKASPSTLASAKAQLAEGDANAAAGRTAQAIANYQQAWLLVSN
jgi:hypothetical protein